jgi:hypothetical protein
MNKRHQLAVPAGPRLGVDELIARGAELVQGSRQIRNDETDVMQTFPSLLQESGQRGIARQRLDELQAKIGALKKGKPGVLGRGLLGWPSAKTQHSNVQIQRRRGLAHDDPDVIDRNRPE